MDMKNKLKELEEKIGYTFHDKDLLEQAMRHSSYANEHHMGRLRSNERLEFLGDAVLELISSDFLYKRFDYRSAVLFNCRIYGYKNKD